ncbi:MAG: undecaprenyldiphospho-muramoylpentapeptide beta-N-acetylglucosaminyltransferase [Nitrospirae bacterium]|nr:MAG: undecaprenyldiphospho-muramoylpentapeptide beta-N-acetylglucosaminyltransferase [Nitrospirota bacterium]
MRVIIAAGGTGGHLYPGVALAREFERQMPGSETMFVGTTRGLETNVVPREGFELITIAARGVMGRGAAGALQGLALVPLGVAQCLAVCRQRRPDLAIGVGGYTSPPLILAAFLLGIRRVIVEPNVHPGVANRALSPVADRVFVSFAETASYFGPAKTRVVGTPIRREFLEGGGADSETAGRTLLILGGSQGARSINRAMVAALPALIAVHPGLRVIHQTGERDFGEVATAYKNAGLNAEVTPFLYDMPRRFRQADLIVSRSGATTVAEITACGKPAVLIPFPHAVHGHQEQNARVLERAGAAQIIMDGRLSGDMLVGAVSALLARPDRLHEMARCSQSLGQADAAERIVSECRALVGAGGASADGALSRGMG